MRKICIIAAALALPAYAPPPPAAPRIVAPAKARADAQSYIRAEDYPVSSLRMGERGRVGFALEVGTDGRVHRCTIVRSSGSTAIDLATCRIMRARARFTPAVDSTGSPARSRVEQEVDWTLPIASFAEDGSSGPGVMVSVSPPPIVFEGPRMVRPPIVAVPQDGPGEAELSLWDGRTDRIANLGRYGSIPDCRTAKAKLELRADQRAYCTLAAPERPGLDLDWKPPR